MKTRFFLPTQPKSFALPVRQIFKSGDEVASPLAGCSTDGHCPHHLRALAPAFKLQASARALASPPVRSQGHPQHLFWLTPHMQSVLLLLSQQRLWGQVLSPRQPCMASLGVPSISHLHALLQPPYSLTVPALVPCCCQVSSCHTASSRHCPA